MIVITNNKRCDCFEKHIANKCDWMSFVDNGQTTLVMPHYVNRNAEKIRYNFCPICGENVRDIEAKRE
jgi:hypothetical protein